MKYADRLEYLLKGLNICLYDEHGNVRNTYKILDELSKVWDLLKKEERKPVCNSILSTDMKKEENMYIINKERGKGKTCELIRDSAKLNIPIICMNRQNAICIKQKSIEMGLDILHPIAINDFYSTKWQYPKVLIDEMPTVLNKLLNVEVVGCSMTGNILN